MKKDVSREDKIQKLRERRKEGGVGDGRKRKAFSILHSAPVIYRVVIVISYASTLVHRFELLRIRINGNLSRNIFHHVSHLLTNGLLNARLPYPSFRSEFLGSRISSKLIATITRRE